ncbi:MAG: MATE family efflux transporter [Oscillospiraceae bacterium]|nr:MATE family efflux transporter [Oscillospiraceae bacterium]MBP1552744.1 MATE family efflux transporter [Oscillospiraceae bacterium]MBP1571212.1 MATE family efflux transporter [Oscillospiraceae bacterium]
MNKNQSAALATEPVGKLLLKLSAPAIAAQIVNLLYNMVDRIYIGHIDKIGDLALTGVGVCFPLIMIISAFAALVGMGAAPRASIFMGKGDKATAEKILGNSFTLLLCVSAVLTVVFVFFAKPILLTFGASENTIGYAMEYMSIYSFGTVFVQLTLGLNAFISAQGFAKISMMTVLIGAVCNIILDPVFIFGLNMGVKGAAIATVISQFISMVWILKFLTGSKTELRIRKENLKLNPQIFLPCMALGLSPFIMQATESLISVCFNSSLLKYGGDIAVGSMTILTSVMTFSILPLQGLCQGSQPIISYNYGAKNADRVKQGFKLTLISCLVFSFTVWALVMLFPQNFIKLFNNNPELVDFASHALRIYMAVNCVFGAQIACQQTFIALGNAKCSLFLALLRKIILLIPLIYILPQFISNKTNAVFLAEPVADIIAVSCTVVLFTVQFRKSMKELKN